MVSDRYSYYHKVKAHTASVTPWWEKYRVPVVLFAVALGVFLALLGANLLIYLAYEDIWEFKTLYVRLMEGAGAEGSIQVPEPVVIRQAEDVAEATQESIEAVGEFFEGVGGSYEENTQKAGEAVGAGVDLGMTWLGTFWKGVTIIYAIIGVGISVGLALNVVEENFVGAAVVGLVASGLFLLGTIGTYFQILDGFFLNIFLYAGLASFFVYMNWGKTGFFAMMYAIVPAFTVTGWIWPDAWKLNGYADWHVYAEALIEWLISMGWI